MIIDEESYLAHYGTLHKSGRYPWGSGKDQSTRNRSFLDTIEQMHKSGMTDVEIAKTFHTKDHPFTTSDLRALKTIATNQQKMESIRTAQKLKDKGMSNVAIGKQMGINESSVRSLLAPGAAERATIFNNTVEMLRREVENKKYLDVGRQAAAHAGVNDTHLKTAVAALKEEGYRLHYLKVQQVGTGEETTYKVLTRPEVTPKEVYANRFNLRQIQEHSDDGGRTGFLGIQPPISIPLKRIGINYAEHGGDKADGVIYVRPGVKDLDMGAARYAQVRIAVNGTHYLKGMAVYKDDLPPGVDLLFNTAKSNSGNKLDALKPLKTDKEGKIDQDNPFGAIVRQLPKLDLHGNEINGTVRSAMNIVNEEGQWDKWSKSLSTQFLSKQSPILARERLDVTYEQKRSEFDEIKSLTNPEVKKKLLESFADDADSSAVHLKAQGLPRQRSQVIMPISSLKSTEIYAPNFNNGEQVVLVRHPHGGTFEIPKLIVNNSNREGIALLGKQAKDAVGINHEVAKRLSGADFDGDTVLVIPNNAGRVKTERALEGLKDFDAQKSYAPYDGMRTIDGGIYRAATKSVDYQGRSPKGGPKQMQMGLVSNLITDMTIKGANHTELAAAVRHSMVVIDAEKHHLDYKASARDNGIPALMKKYQDGRAQGGSSTLISRAKSEIRINDRKARPASEGGPIDRVTGEKRYVPTGAVYSNGRPKQIKVTKLGEAKDAHRLSSGTTIEAAYADHSNRLKALANQARLELVHTQSRPYSPSAKEAFKPQVETLKAKLAIAEQNAPRERQAQVLANSIVAMKKDAYPGMDAGDLKKIKGQALVEARIRTGAKKERVEITPEEWAAIQAGAISNNMLKRIISNADLAQLKELATPRTRTEMTPLRLDRARSMLALGYTQAQVAADLGVSVTTLKNNLS